MDTLVFYLVSLFVMNKNTFIKRVSLFVAMVIVVVFWEPLFVRPGRETK